MSWGSAAEKLFYAFIGFAIAMMIGDANDWGCIKVAWETLLAGFAAVVAAYYTVLQMRKSDRNADLREIARRKRSAEVLKRTLVEFNRAARNISGLWKRDVTDDISTIVERARWLESNGESIIKLLYSDLIRKIIPDLDPEAQVAFVRCEQAADYVVSTSKILLDAARSDGKRDGLLKFVRELDADCERHVTSFAIYWNTLRDCVDGTIATLAKELG